MSTGNETMLSARIFSEDLKPGAGFAGTGFGSGGRSGCVRAGGGVGGVLAGASAASSAATAVHVPTKAPATIKTRSPIIS
jgi:hypothetical protein